MEAPTSVPVEGYCPMGCGQTLAAIADSPVGRARIECTWGNCPKPEIVDMILSDPMGKEHVVELGEDGFSLAHPLREHFADLSQCSLHLWLLAQDGPPVGPGKYKARERVGEGGWRFDPIP